MNENLIKGFDFSDFLDSSWKKWKFASLTDAWEKAYKKIKESKEPDSSNSNAYAYAGNVSKSPILWDKEDWKFLSQFPPMLWSQALMWRYNEGINEAAKTREAHGKVLDQVQDMGDVVLNYRHKKYVFSGIYTGLRTLMEKLEQPTKYHSKHTPPGTQENDPGIADIDPFQKDANHEKYRGKYKYGLHNFDITSPVEYSDEYIDSLSDDEIKLPKDQERTPENIKAAKDKLRKNRRRDFAGMSAINSEVLASKHMHNWLKTQGLGLLGNVPDKMQDPHTGEELNVAQNQSPAEIDKRWGTHADKNKKVPLGLPIITRNLSYKEIDSKGNETQVNKPVKMPVLNPGVLLPRIIDLSPQQRKIIAERSGFKAEDKCSGIAGLDWSAIEDKCPAAKQAGQMDDLRNLINNFDILTPEQKDHLKTNQRDLYHLVAARYGANDDRWSQPGEHYTVGYNPNYGKRAIEPSDLTKPEMKAVLDKYLPQVTAEADQAIGYYINWAKRKERLPPEVISMLETIHTDLSQVAGALLALNLQHPHLGLRDPDVKLTNVPEDYDPEENEQNRRNWAWNFAKDLAQAAFGDVPSRRQRQRQGTGRVSLDADRGTGDTSTSLGANVSQGDQNIQGGNDWDTRRGTLDPITQGVHDPVTNQTTYSIARLGWNIPKMDHAIDTFFNTKRNQILAKVGGEFASITDKASARMKAVLDTIRELYEKHASELMAQGVPQEEIEKKANDEVDKMLHFTLTSKYPDLFQGVDKAQVSNILQAQKSQLGGQVLTPELKDEQDKLWNGFFFDLITKKKGWVPELKYDEEEKEYFFDAGNKIDLDLLKGKNAKDVVGMIKTIGGEEKGDEMAKLYGVGLLRAIKHNDDQEMSLEDAIKAIKDAGVIPVEDQNPEDQPEEPKAAAPVTAPQATPAPTPAPTAAPTVTTPAANRPGASQAWSTTNVGVSSNAPSPVKSPGYAAFVHNKKIKDDANPDDILNFLVSSRKA